MIIAQSTFDAVREMNIATAIEHFNPKKMTKKGKDLKSLSPFVEEKTESFSVSVAKNCWKCFSSGYGGSGVASFVMQLNSCTYVEAVKEIAQAFGFLEFEQSENGEKYQQKREEKEKLIQANTIAREFFSTHVEKQPPNVLRATPKDIEAFQIGFAPGSKTLLQHLRAKGVTDKTMIDAGLISKKDKGINDFFFNRIIFPIHNEKHECVGFGGRKLPEDTSKSGKYINTKSTLVYDKQKQLYGIEKAKPFMNKTKTANLVEGYYDVIACHNGDMPNTVATCGTALTEHHAEIIKKYADKIRLITENDYNYAGENATARNIPILLKLGFNVTVAIMPLGEDTDSLINNGPAKQKAKKTERESEYLSSEQKFEIQGQIQSRGFDKYFSEFEEDGVFWLVKKWMKDAEGIHEQTHAEKQMHELLSLIPDNKVRNNYVRALAKEHSLSKADVEKSVKTHVVARKNDSEDDFHDFKIPNYLDREEYFQKGFCMCENQGSKTHGYHFQKANQFKNVSNFIVKPLFHINSPTDNKRIIELVNWRKERDCLIDIPSKGFVNMQQFHEAVVENGPFLWMGDKIQYQLIMADLLERFQTCYEIKILGWQPEGFYAFANGIVDQRFKPVNDYGIASFGSKDFFLPAFSKIYDKMVGTDDKYTHARNFVYKPTKVTFEEWAKLFVRVHGNNGRIGILHIMASLFRDHIYKIHKVFPHLHLFGGIQTGKSYMARSGNAIFHGAESGLSLNAASDAGFFRKMAQFSNAIVWLDEYHNDLPGTIFQYMKTSYDGIGRITGKKTMGVETQMNEVLSSLWISGQYLPTRDDNALYSRELVLTFLRKAEHLTKDDIKQGAKLKAWEDEGLSEIIISIINFRNMVEEEFKPTNMEILQQLKEELPQGAYNGRVMLNFSIVLTISKMFEGKLKLPFTFEEIYKQSVEMILDQSAKISQSDALGNFWAVVEDLFFSDQFYDKNYFKIESPFDLKVGSGKKQQTINFGGSKEILYMSVKRVWRKYAELEKKSGKTDIIGSQSLMEIMKGSPYFIGTVKAVRFDDVSTSAFCFDYSMVPATLRKNENPKEQPTGNADGDQEDLPF